MARKSVRPAAKAETRADPAPRPFGSSQAFRAWLEKHHAARRVLWIQCFKKHAAHRGITYRQALDEALCFGWIDGVVCKVDTDSYGVRFTPRQAKSIWSRVNLKRIHELVAEGRVTAAGEAALALRDEARTGIYSFERAAMWLSPDLEARFTSNASAWSYFNAEPPGYRRTCVFWVMSAKREATRARRLDILIDCAARHTRIPLLLQSSSSKARTS
jgi:uncharacterized protein YdeI (YjbR/CyaY-like superfamily)